MRGRLALVIWLCAAPAVAAGPWPRDKGAGFVAISSDGTRQQIHAEYGIGADWTLGVEATRAKGHAQPSVAGFVHHPVWRGKGGAILSAGLAVETRESLAARSWAHMAGTGELAVRAGLFWGKGFESRWGNGWMVLEAQVERVVTKDWIGARHSGKLDATIGLSPHDRIKLMVQAQGWMRQGGKPQLRIEPAAAVKFGRAHLVAAPSVGVLGPRDARVKLGLWLDF
ncbi:MAG: hypothetical protein ACK4RN_03780 [Pseudorhodobacter sp.]